MRLPIILFSVVALIIIQIFLVKPFFHEGFFPTHDDIQTIRIFEYYQSLKFGEFPPRWSSGLLYGYGYPLFIFYNPLVYFLGSIFVFLGFNFLAATKIIFILGFCIGVVGIFFLAKSFIGDFPAFITAAIYSFIPYRAVDVYVRGDLAEFFAYSFFPLVFWINLKLLDSKKNNLYLYFFAIFLAILILTHNISAFIYTIFLMIFNIFYNTAYLKDQEKLIMTKKIFLGSLIALLVSSFYWLPLILEVQFVQTEKILSFPYADYFLTLKQIWQSPFGYSGFLQENPMSLQLGQVIIVISLLTLFLNIFIKTYYRKFIFFMEIIFIVSILLETKISQFFWDHITILHYLQFPWRLHILNTICGIVLIGFFFYFLENIKIYQKKVKYTLILSIGIFLILISFKESTSFFKERNFIEAKPVAATTTGEEYLPKWVKSLPNNYPADKIQLLDSGKIENIKWGYYQKEFTAILEKNTKVKISHIYYPGWQAYINNINMPIEYNNKYGLMEINLPKGINYVRFSFERTWWRLTADIISFSTILTIILLITKEITYRKKVELRR